MKIKTIIILFSSFFLMLGCTDSNTPDSASNTIQNVPITVTFNTDSAYQYIQDQVDFGPRVPGSLAHKQTAEYLQKKLSQYCDTSFIQQGVFNNIAINNIIGSINQDKKNRILLCAHWDTRPMADQDIERPTEPADGANDGASGVGVIIEIARQLQQKKPNVGVDIVFFDAEDMGEANGAATTWCLGSQYWSKNPHKSNYIAEFGILLDMVGPKNAVFAIEANSWMYAQLYVKNVWNTAKRLGHGRFFNNSFGGQLVDDHLFINQNLGIPTLDIIHYDTKEKTGFGDFWHTHKDNMETIDKITLKAVGETVLQVVMDK